MSIKDFRTRNEILVLVNAGKDGAGPKRPQRRGQVIPSKLKKRHLPRRGSTSDRFINFYDLGMLANGANAASPFSVDSGDPAAESIVRAYANAPLAYPLATWKTRYKRIRPADTVDFYRISFTTHEAGGVAFDIFPDKIRKLSADNPDWTNNGYRYNERLNTDPDNWTLNVRGGWDVLDTVRARKFYESGPWGGTGSPGDAALSADLFEPPSGTSGFDTAADFVTRPDDGSYRSFQAEDDGTDIDFFLNPGGYFVQGLTINKLVSANRETEFANRAFETNSRDAALSRWLSVVGIPGGTSTLTAFVVGGFFTSFSGLTGAIHQSGRWYLLP